MNHSIPQQLEIKYPDNKFCECGCGQLAPIAKKTNSERGHTKGKPVRFIAGHNIRLRKQPSLEERFWNKIKVGNPDECWEWNGAITKKGYGNLRYNKKYLRAHRVSYELHYGSIPDDPDDSFHGICVCHACDNPACVNPAHLFLGTIQDNIDDKITKKRQPAGSRHYRTTLSEKDVLKIRSKWKTGQHTQSELGQEYGVSRETIYGIVNRRSWRHI